MKLGGLSPIIPYVRPSVALPDLRGHLLRTLLLFADPTMLFMRRSLALLALLVIAGCASAHAPTDFTLIPQPAALTPGKGAFTLGPESRILLDDADDGEALRLAEFWAEPVRAVTGWALPTGAGPCRDGAICIEVSTTDSGGPNEPEGYALTVTPHRIVIAGDDHAGLFYGLQTLTQMLPASLNGSPVQVAAATIVDSPRLRYRGMHLDVGRHFFGPDFVKRYIDELARYKINRFHWHLTEDQGWRIEIERYPRLTEVGAFRAETMVEKNFDPFVGDGERYGGFYTQAEIRDIVAYARERYVTIVPEIEMPGHSLAALAAYPELACTEGPFEVGTTWGVFDDIYCPKEETFEFLQNVLTEVMALFPGEYIHIGGDEAPKARWKESDIAQAVIQREGLADESELQSWFIRRIERFLNEHGRRLIGWDEILEGGLAPNATVMSWRGTEGGIEAARQGHDVVMTPTSYLYFDYYQGDPESEPLAIGGYLPLERVYRFDPLPDELDDAEGAHILGAQGNVWTEYMTSEDQVEYMVFPRLMALSEITWSRPSDLDFRDFTRRLPPHLAGLDARGVHYRIPDVVGLDRDRITLDDNVRLSLMAPAHGTIHYTLDGSEPDADGPVYEKPLKLELGDGPLTVAARILLPDGRKGPVRRATFEQVQPRPAALVTIPLEPGLTVDLFEGRFRSVSEFEADGTQPTLREKTDDVSIPDAAPAERFGLRFRGYLSVPEDGVYAFRLTSDDGAVLRFTGTVVLDHDGPHGASPRTADVALSKGLHPFEVLYFQGEGGKTLSLEWAAPGGEFTPLGRDVVSRVP